MIVQWGFITTKPSSATYTINGLLFSTANYFITFKTIGDNYTEREFRFQNYPTDKLASRCKIQMNIGNSGYPCPFAWFAIGY